MAQGLFLPLLSSATPAQQAAMLSLFALPATSSASLSARISQQTPNRNSSNEIDNANNDVLNLSKKRNTDKPAAAQALLNPVNTDQAAVLNNLNLSEVLALASLPPGLFSFKFVYCFATLVPLF